MTSSSILNNIEYIVDKINLSKVLNNFENIMENGAFAPGADAPFSIIFSHT